MTTAEDVEEAPTAVSLGVGTPQDKAAPKDGSSMYTDSSATEDINQMTKMSVKTEEGKLTKQHRTGRVRGLRDASSL